MIAPALLLAASLTWPSVAPARPALERWRPLIIVASRRFGVPSAWISAVIRIESGGRCRRDGRPITSSAGAMGLMQLMPGTWAELRARYGFGGDPYDPHDNILAGAAYLRRLYIRYGYPNLFAAYDAGPAALDAYLLRKAALPPETRAYLAALGQMAAGETQVSSGAERSGLFFSLRTTTDHTGGSP